MSVWMKGGFLWVTKRRVAPLRMVRDQPQAGAVVRRGQLPEQNEFVEKAVNFYVDYLEMRDAQSLLPTALLAVLDGRLGRLEDLIARREYTREVELDMVIGIIADAMEIDRDDLKRRRAESVRNVKTTNGLISLEKRARAAEEPNWDGDQWQD
ncbi:MAG: hypothetical protein ACLSB9_17885 [Hydrogeniiclostridium mannosilyticum]